MIYYLFRHGETKFSLGNIPYHEHEHTASFLPQALPSIRRIGDYLKNEDPTKFFTSPYKRCLDTVAVIKKITKSKFQPDERLGEYIEGKFDLMVENLQSFLEDLNLTNPPSVAICTHGAVVAGLKHLIAENHFEIDQLMDYPQCGIVTKISPEGIEEIDFR